MTRQVNDATLALIKNFEGCSLSAYQDSGSIWTEGYGHTQGINANSEDITQDIADAWLLSDLEYWQDFVERTVTVSLNDNQFGALVSLSYNVGIFPLQGGALGEILNRGDYDAASQHILLYNKAGGVIVAGLVRRRQAEFDLFNS